MAVRYELLLNGNNLSFRGGFFGFCNVVLVTALDGTRILFDTGHYCVRKGLLAALAQRQISPQDIDIVFLSHLHFDHCQNLDLFTRATVCVSAAEMTYARAPHAEDYFVPWKIHDLLGDMKVRVLDAAQDGDEIAPGVQHFAVPGHTPGSQALHFVQHDGQRVVLAGDAVKYAKEIIAQVGDACFSSRQASADSIARIREMADIVVPGHFPTLFKRNGQWLWDEPATLELLMR